MSEVLSSPVRVRIEATSVEVPSLQSFQPFAVGRTTGSDDRLLFVRGSFTRGHEAIVPAADCLLLSKDVDATRAILALPLASVLALWEMVGLELGEAAIWTAGSPLSQLAGQVALWRGGCPAIQVGPKASAPFEGADMVDWADAEIATNRLKQLIAASPGFAAVDLSGRADVIDVFLEGMPTFGRLVLAGSTGEPVTLDYYSNIHRKGAIIRTVIMDPAQVFDADAGAAIRAELGRALEILRNPVTADLCRALLLEPVALQPEMAVAR